MLLKNLDPMIKEIAGQIPVAYYAFPKPGQAPPYLVYYSPGRSDFFADDLNYQGILDLNIELYTKTKNYSLEQSIEAAMTAKGLAYGKIETFIESDGVFQITYTTEVIINAEQ